MPISDPAIPVYSNVTGFQHNNSTQLTELFCQQLQMSVCLTLVALFNFHPQSNKWSDIIKFKEMFLIITKFLSICRYPLDHKCKRYMNRYYLNLNIHPQVRWQSLIENMVAEYGDDLEFHEVGPSRQISAMIHQIHRPSRRRTQATDSGPRS